MAIKKEEKKGKGEPKFAAAAGVILEAMVDGVTVTDGNGNIIQTNKAFAEMHGYKVDELLGKNPTELVSKREIPKVIESIEECIKKGFVRNIESIGMRNDGSEFPIQLNVTTLKDETGKSVGVIAVLRDITELKRLQEKEKEAAVDKAHMEEAEKSAVYIDAMGDALLVLDARGKIIKSNKAAEKLWGYTSEEFFKMTWDQTLVKSVHEKTAAEMEESVKTGSIRPFDLIILTKDGREISVQISGTAMKDAEGKLAGFVGVFRDITEIKKAQEELQKKVRELEEFAEIAVERELDMKKLEEESERLRGKK